MKITITALEDLITPDLQARLSRAQNKARIHTAVGTALVGLTKRAFNDATLRPTAWPALASGAPARLRKSGTLAKSIRLLSATDSSVAIGTDRKYAAIHQLGGTTAPHVIRPRNGKALLIPGIGFRGKVNHPGSKIAARPFFPFDRLGKPTPTAHRQILEIVSKMLDPKKALP